MTLDAQLIIKGYEQHVSLAEGGSTGQWRALQGPSYLCHIAGGSAPQHAVDEPLGAKHQKAQTALVTPLLPSCTPWVAEGHVDRGGTATKKAPSFSSQGTPSSLELLLCKPQLVAAVRFPVCVCPTGLSQCQIGSVPRIYLLVFQAEHHYKQLN